MTLLASGLDGVMALPPGTLMGPPALCLREGLAKVSGWLAGSLTCMSALCLGDAQGFDVGGCLPLTFSDISVVMNHTQH